MNNTEVEKILQEQKHDFSSLVRIMEILRSENGCPWDLEQTHQSIRANLIEETYEVVEAIDTENPALLREELGDVLLQVIFHARIAEEEGQFQIDDVIHEICEKLIHRHPHIFSDVHASTSQEVLATWEKIKTEEKKQIGLSGALAAIPPALPALMRAQKSVKKCINAGFVPEKADLLESLSANVGKMKESVEQNETEKTREYLSDILFSASAMAQILSIDSEEILNRRISTLLETVCQYEQSVENSETSNSSLQEEWVNRFFDGKNGKTGKST